MCRLTTFLGPSCVTILHISSWLVLKQAFYHKLLITFKNEPNLGVGNDRDMATTIQHATILLYKDAENTGEK